ncbi:hypothetical protein RRG08_007891 [Elysia crispata]|uniref:Uncharacterized protein n=1 Tax=Elysia crispata TaxID=231223 RepID=A0AAE0XWH2_9GAST|nr:hypothetical protein RRG08_007891 [Elysia crispata]
MPSKRELSPEQSDCGDACGGACGGVAGAPSGTLDPPLEGALAGAPAGPLAGSLVKASPLAGPPAGPTAADFLDRLDRLEARVEEASRLLVQALAQLPKDDDSDVLEELLVDEQQEIAEQLRETRHEQAETRMDLQKVGQVVETAQNWAYISIAAVIVWKVVTATWNRCTPRQKPQPQKPQPQEVESAKPGDPFYMA